LDRGREIARGRGSKGDREGRRGRRDSSYGTPHPVLSQHYSTRAQDGLATSAADTHNV